MKKALYSAERIYTYLILSYIGYILLGRTLMDGGSFFEVAIRYLILLGLAMVSLAGPVRCMEKSTPQRRKLFKIHFVILAIVYAILFCSAHWAGIIFWGDTDSSKVTFLKLLVIIFRSIWAFIMYYAGWGVVLGVNIIFSRTAKSCLQDVRNTEVAAANAAAVKRQQEEAAAARQEQQERCRREQEEAAAARQRSLEKQRAEEEETRQAKARRTEQVSQFWDLAFGPDYGADSACRGLVSLPYDFSRATKVVYDDKEEYRERKNRNTDTKIYYLDADLLGFHYCLQPQMWVSNDDWAKTIEDFLGSVGLYPDLIQQEIYEAPRLAKLCENQSPLADIWGLPSDCLSPAATKEIPSDCIDNLRIAISERERELNALLAVRAQWYMEEFRIIASGLYGEEFLRKTLDLHAGAFYVFYNLRLEFPNADGRRDSVETDALVLAPNGLFAIEAKNYGAHGKYAIDVSAAGTWYKTFPDSKYDKRQKLANPAAQNDRHIAFLERFINDLLHRDMTHWAHVESVIAIANDEVDLNIAPGAEVAVLRVGNLYGFMMRDKTPRFTGEELDILKKALEERALPPKKYPAPDFRDEIRMTVEAYRRLFVVAQSGKNAMLKCLEEHPEFLTPPAVS